MPLWHESDTRPTNPALRQEDGAEHSNTTSQTASQSPKKLVRPTDLLLNGLPPPVTHSGPASFKMFDTPPKTVKQRLLIYWNNFTYRLGTVSVPDTIPLSNTNYKFGDSQSFDGENGEKEGPVERPKLTPAERNAGVDQVVVDREWPEELKHAYAQQEADQASTSLAPQNDTSSELSRGGVVSPYYVLRYRIWPRLIDVFNVRFEDKRAELAYRQDAWALNKPLTLWSSLWLIINWILGCAFTTQFLVIDKAFYIGIAPTFSFPVVALIMYDMPRDRPTIYQSVVTISVWIWPFYQVLFMFLCGFYPNTPQLFGCGTRDFLGTSYYTTALQAIALFGLGLKRLPAAIGATAFFIFSCSAIIPNRTQWTRTMINFAVYHIFLIYVHYMRETAERTIFRLKEILRVQYKETQRAQMNEREAAESKRRITSYVRVPLNTATLAMQNLEASGTIAKEQEFDFMALQKGLTTMAQVLNDVLDFHRMDSGNFESVSKPYSFHHALRSLVPALQLSTDKGGLKLIMDLDPNIDLVARHSAYQALGQRNDDIVQHIKDNPDVDGVVTGDEVRLRQIITNLVNNACKFTNKGGQLTVKTQLALPETPPELGALTKLVPAKRRDPAAHVKGLLNDSEDDPELESIEVVHIGDGEVHTKEDDGRVRVRMLDEPQVLQLEADDGQTHGHHHEPERIPHDKNIHVATKVKLSDKVQTSERALMQSTAQGYMMGQERGRSHASISELEEVVVDLPPQQKQQQQSRQKLASSPKVIQETRSETNHARDQDRENGQQKEDVEEIERVEGPDSAQWDGSNLRPLDYIVIRLEVIDSGIGMCQKDVSENKLFSAFNQTEKGRLQGGKGTGLGLALVRQIVKSSGGRLGVRSAPGKGSTFWIEMPVGVGIHALKALAEDDTAPLLPQLDAFSTQAQWQTTEGRTIPEEFEALSKLASESETAPAASVVRGVIEQVQQNIKARQQQQAEEAAAEEAAAAEARAMLSESSRPSRSTTPSPQSNTRDGNLPFTPQGTDPAPRGDDSRPSTSRGTRAGRPTYVPIPSPRMFMPDSKITPATSDSGSSAMAQFDSGLRQRQTPSSVVPPDTTDAVGSTRPYDGKLRALVVDDDLVTRRLMQKMLTRLGCDVVVAENGYEAVTSVIGYEIPHDLPSPDAFSLPGDDLEEHLELSDMLKVSEQERVPHDYDVIFLDNRMPIMSGFEAVAALRRLGRDELVVGVTGDALLSDQQEFLEAGVNYVLPKPMNERYLKEVLVRVRESRKQRNLRKAAVTATASPR